MARTGGAGLWLEASAEHMNAIAPKIEECADAHVPHPVPAVPPKLGLAVAALAALDSLAPPR
jgi:hypothetical protein